MVSAASQWRWSSAAVHCGVAAPENWLDLESWQKRWTVDAWIGYLGEGDSPDEVTALRQFTHTGRPLGAAPFVARLEQATLRLLAPRKRGRRQKPVADLNQPPIAFVS